MSFHKPQIQIQTTGTAVLRLPNLSSPKPPVHLETMRQELEQMIKIPKILVPLERAPQIPEIQG